MRSDLLAILRAIGSPYGRRLHLVTPPEDSETLPAEALRRPEGLRRAIERAAATLGTADLRVAGSLWQKEYNASVMAGALAAMTLAGVGLDLSLPRVQILLREGLPSGLFLPDLSGTVILASRFPGSAPRCCPVVSSPGELHRFVLTALLEQHLSPVFAQLRAVTRLSMSIIWGNAANLCADLYEKLAQDPAARPAALHDRQALLETPRSSCLNGQNPLFNRVDYLDLNEPGLPATVRVRRSCCQRYRLTDRKPCYTCPRLSHAERIQLLRELGPS